MGQIDASYRLLFSSPALMQALLATPWLAPLTQAFDLSSLKPVSNDLLSSRLRQRRADLVWQVVLYSGVRRWSAPVQLRALIDAVPAPLERFQPAMEYVLVDEGALVGRHAEGTNRTDAGQQPGSDHTLGGATALLPSNLAHILFRLEHNKGVDDVVALLKRLAQLTAGPEYEELQRAFAAWVRYVLWPRVVPEGRKVANLP